MKGFMNSPKQLDWLLIGSFVWCARKANFKHQMFVVVHLVMAASRMANNEGEFMDEPSERSGKGLMRAKMLDELLFSRFFKARFWKLSSIVCLLSNL